MHLQNVISIGRSRYSSFVFEVYLDLHSFIGMIRYIPTETISLGFTIATHAIFDGTFRTFILENSLG